MKKLSLLATIFAAVALFTQPVSAEEAVAQMAGMEAAGADQKMDAHENMMQESMEKMRAQMATIKQTRNSKKRLKLLQEHSKSMRDSLKMMHEMMGSMAMGCAMGSGHKMDGGMMGCCMMGGSMKGSCMQGDHKMGGAMQGGCMKDGGCCMQGGSCMKGGCMKEGGCCMQGGACMKGGMAGDNTNAASVAQANPEQMSSADKTSTKAGGKVWVCPMHPNVVRDQPGTCPICGMDLVEMDQSGASQSGHNHMSGGCMGCMNGGNCMKGGSCMMGGGMMDKHMGMMLFLMEQMIEHDEAVMATRK